MIKYDTLFDEDGDLLNADEDCPKSSKAFSALFRINGELKDPESLLILLGVRLGRGTPVKPTSDLVKLIMANKLSTQGGNFHSTLHLFTELRRGLSEK
jgi:hypothetical protein